MQRSEMARTDSHLAPMELRDEWGLGSSSRWVHNTREHGYNLVAVR